MHDHDLDLIAAHADGTLDDLAAQVEAARLVEACPVCATEFRTQQTVKGWLGAAPSVTLTETERSRLHADVAAQTGSEASVASLPAKAAGRRSGALRPEHMWVRLSAVAAGFEPPFVDRVINTIRANQFKRMPPIIAKLSNRTVGYDFLYLRDWGT